MKAVSIEAAGPVSVDGSIPVRAIIVSDSTPAALPTNGADVVGMSANQVFAPFSMLYVVGDADAKVYIANEQGVFVPQ